MLPLGVAEVASVLAEVPPLAVAAEVPPLGVAEVASVLAEAPPLVLAAALLVLALRAPLGVPEVPPLGVAEALLLRAGALLLGAPTPLPRRPVAPCSLGRAIE